MEEKRKIEVHSANMRAVFEKKVADLETETRQSKDQLRTGFAEKKSLLDQVDKDIFRHGKKFFLLFLV